MIDLLTNMPFLFCLAIFVIYHFRWCVGGDFGISSSKHLTELIGPEKKKAEPISY